MRNRSITALSLLITLAVPVIAVGNTAFVLFQPRLVDVVYSVPGFPEDRYGLSGEERRELAREGVRSVAPVGPGADHLRKLDLPDGQAAFTAEEVEHMHDVRDLVTSIAVAWLVALCLAGIAAFGLRRAGRADLISAGARRGALLAAGAVVVLGAAMIFDFDRAFSGFHEIFFEEGTWTFASEQTLIRLFPEMFWSVAAIFASTLTAVQLAALWIATRQDGRQLASRYRLR